MSDSPKPSPEKIVNHMLKHDTFSQWLGIQLIDVGKGKCTLQCTLNDEMLNAYEIAHGGIIFSLADSAVAFASATFGRVAVTVDHSISFIKKAVSGDVLTIKAETVSMGSQIGVIKAEVTNNEKELIAVAKGTVYRTSELFKF